MVIDCAKLERDGVRVTAYEGVSLSTKSRYLVLNNGRMGVFVETGGSPTRLSIEIPQTLDDQRVLPREVYIPANSLYGLGDWPTEIYNDAAAQVALSFASVTGVRMFCACVS